MRHIDSDAAIAGPSPVSMLVRRRISAASVRRQLERESAPLRRPVLAVRSEKRDRGSDGVVGRAAEERLLELPGEFPERPADPLPGQPDAAEDGGGAGDNSPGMEQVEHVIVLMLENRSFDHMLGYLSSPVPCLRPTKRRPDTLIGHNPVRRTGLTSGLAAGSATSQREGCARRSEAHQKAECFVDRA